MDSILEKIIANERLTFNEYRFWMLSQGWHPWSIAELQEFKNRNPYKRKPRAEDWYKIEKDFALYISKRSPRHLKNYNYYIKKQTSSIHEIALQQKQEYMDGWYPLLLKGTYGPSNNPLLQDFFISLNPSFVSNFDLHEEIRKKYSGLADLAEIGL